MGKANNPQMERERAVYSYLDALESGDIDGIIESLQQAVYDAPLDQMLVDAHQAYFQEAQVQQVASVEMETPEISALEPATLRSLGPGQSRRAGVKKMSRWVQTLAAVLILGVLVGSFITVLALRKPGAPGTSPLLLACQPYPLRLFDVQNTTTTVVPPNTVLSSVTTVSPNDAWAVGNAVSAPGSQSASDSTFIVHWDGMTWQVVPSPNSGIDGNGSLKAVAAVSATDVWAVGSSSHGTVPQGESPLDISRPLIEHWDGSNWQIMSNSGYGEQLNSLVAISQNDIWAAGSFAGGQTGHLFFEHWNGTDWQQYRWEPRLPDGSSGVSLADIVAISANDIWAVGVSRSASGKQNAGLVMHWNGSQWQPEPTPPGSQMLYGASALSAQNLWVTGVDLSGHPLIEHWDGQQWNTAALPDSLANPQTSLRGISAASANDIWAVANVTGGNQSASPAQSVILHWNGKAWSLVSTLSDSSVNGITISGGQIWIVGDPIGASASALILLGQHVCP